MLRTNTKKARQNVQTFIIDHFTPEGYTDTPPQDWSGIANCIMDTFSEEFYSRDYRKNVMNKAELFKEWVYGIPGIVDIDYLWYDGTAINYLGDILEETEAERNRFTDQQAIERLTYLIYRELEKATA